MSGTVSLFDRYPGTASLCLAGVASVPTPTKRLGIVLDAADVLVKRDDLTSARYGGNKVRKLDFLLGDALVQGAQTVLTFGAYGSNHALATAVHARALGLEPHVVLSPQEPGPFAARTLLAHAGLATHIHVADGWDGRRAAVEARRALRERDGVDPYVIPMGGTCPLGALGYVSAALEFAEDPPDVVYVAAGTLGTAVGLAVGFAALGAPTRVEAIRVTPSELANAQVAETLAAGTVELLRSLDPTFPALAASDLRLVLRDDHFEPGYGIVTDATADAVRIARGAGLHLETTYTGKAFSAMLVDGELGKLDGERVLFWDTYNSAPYPAPGPVERLPEVLQDYVAECERLFGAVAAAPADEGDAE